MNSELVLLLLGIAALGILLGVLVLPIVAFIRTRRIPQLARRIDRLENRLAERPAAAARQVSEAAPRSASPLAGDAEQLAAINARLDRLETMVGQAQPAAAPLREPPGRRIPDALPAEPEPAPRVLPRQREVDASALEEWIGRRALGWVSVVLLFFATAFFLKYAFENNWIGPQGRISMGALTGVLLCGGGFYYHRKGWHAFSQMITASAVVLLYLTIYAAFGYYHLIEQQSGAIFLIVLVAEAAALALLYEAPAIALMAVIGGLLAPVLLHADRDQYRSLFAYLTILNAGTVGLILLRRWHGISTVALLGTQVLFWLWYSEHYHPEKRPAAFGFQLAIFGLFLAYSFFAQVAPRRPAGVEDLARLVLNAFFFFGTTYALLDEDYHVWMATSAVVLAGVYAGLGWLVLVRTPEDQKHLLVAVATAMGLVALAIPLQASAAWIPVGWAVQALALWWFSLRVRSRILRGFGAVLFLFAVGRLVLIDTPYARREPFIPLLNEYGSLATLVAACVLSAAAAARRLRAQLDAADKHLLLITGLAGILLLWFVLSVETYGYFVARLDSLPSTTDYQTIDVERWYHWADATLSGVWAAYAAVILWVGFRLRSLPLRGTALALFALTVSKVVLYDMAQLPGLYRVAAFLATAIMVGVAAWAYQKVQHLQQGARAGGEGS